MILATNLNLESDLLFFFCKSRRSRKRSGADDDRHPRLREGAGTLAAATGKAHAEALTDPNLEQVREVLRKPNVLEEPDGHLRVEIDQNIDIARLKSPKDTSPYVSAMSLGPARSVLARFCCRFAADK